MKLIVSDIDGTLFPSKYVKNSNQLRENLDAVKKWVNSGNQFAIASARSIRDYDYLRDIVGMDINFIAANGASIRYIDGTKKELFINSSIFYLVADYIDENGWDASVICANRDKWLWYDFNHYPMSTNEISDEMRKGATLAIEGDVEPNTNITKVSVFVSKENRDALVSCLKALWLNAEIVTCDVDMIDILPKNASKANGIHSLCEYYHVSLDDVYVVGDSENDVSMFEITKNSYCIDHAEDTVKSKARYVVSSVKEMIDGLL